MVHTGDTADQNKTVWKVLFTYYLMDKNYSGQFTAGDLEIGILAIRVALVSSTYHRSLLAPVETCL